MRRLVFIGLFLAWGCVVTNAQQILFVNPGGIVVIEKCNTIAMVGKNLSKDEMTFEHEGRTYPNGGQAYFDMLEKNPIKYNVIDKVLVRDGKIQFDGKAIDVNVKVDRIYKALKWGDLIACLGIIPNESKHWLEPKNAHALIIFSPISGKGSFKVLYLDAGKAGCDMWLLDSVEKEK